MTLRASRYRAFSRRWAFCPCLLDEQTMARFRESSLYKVQDEMMTNDFGLWGTFTSEDKGVIRDAEEFMAERGLLTDR